MKKVYGHASFYVSKRNTPKDPKMQIAIRYSPKTFYKLTSLCEKEGVSVNAKVNQIIEKYLGVK